jgi:hypothetical protein
VNSIENGLNFSIELIVLSGAISRHVSNRPFADYKILVGAALDVDL